MVHISSSSATKTFLIPQTWYEILRRVLLWILWNDHSTYQILIAWTGTTIVQSYKWSPESVRAWSGPYLTMASTSGTAVDTTSSVHEETRQCCRRCWLNDFSIMILSLLDFMAYYLMGLIWVNKLMEIDTVLALYFKEQYNRCSYWLHFNNPLLGHI